jgi:hypothetical protein
MDFFEDFLAAVFFLLAFLVDFVLAVVLRVAFLRGERRGSVSDPSVCSTRLYPTGFNL